MIKVKYERWIAYSTSVDTKEFDSRKEADAWITEQQRTAKSTGGHFKVLEVESTGAAALSRVFG